MLYLNTGKVLSNIYRENIINPIRHRNKNINSMRTANLYTFQLGRFICFFID